MSFKFSNDNPASAQARLSRLGAASAKTDPGSSIVTVADDQPSQILEIVSIVTPVASLHSTGSIRPPLSAKNFWAKRETNPVKDRVNELDQLQAKNANDIRDVDSRAVSGMKNANDAAALADSHAGDAATRVDAANTTATTSSTRNTALLGTVSNLDQYRTVQSTSVAFVAGRTTLGKRAKADLDYMVAKLGTEKGHILEVQGYSRAGVANSQAMADSVVRYLVIEHGVPIYRIYRSDTGKTTAESADGEKMIANGVRVTLLQDAANSVSTSLPKWPSPSAATGASPFPSERHVTSASRPGSQVSRWGATSRPITPGTPTLFFQEDAEAPLGSGTDLVTKFRQNWPEIYIQGKIQRIPTTKMPSMSQVRFFNAGDEPLANACRDRLSSLMGINARVVRIGLAAPSGQIEVWLSKAALR